MYGPFIAHFTQTYNAVGLMLKLYLLFVYLVFVLCLHYLFIVSFLGDN